jgi:hypothetical protein
MFIMSLKGVFSSFKEFWGFLPYWFRGFIIGALFPILLLLLALILGFFLDIPFVKYPYDFLVSFVWYPYSVFVGTEYGAISNTFTIFLIILISAIFYGLIAFVIGLIIQLIKFRSFSKTNISSEISKTKVNKIPETKKITKTSKTSKKKK